MRVVRRGSALSLDALPAELSYAPVGRSLGEMPPGYVHLDRTWPLPDGSFAAAAEAVTTWAMHRGSGLRVLAEPLAPGSAVLQAVRFGPAELLAPCRVVAVVEGGFAYGTLAGHPESGEESFVVHADGARTWLAIRSYSRLASAVARLGTPVARRVQSRAVDAYATALLSLL